VRLTVRQTADAT